MIQHRRLKRERWQQELQIEEQKWKHELKREVAKRVHDRSAEFHSYTNKAAIDGANLAQHWLRKETIELRRLFLRYEAMKHRGVEYYIAQGVEAGTWKFSTSMNDKIRTLRGKSKQQAVEAVQRTIDKTLDRRNRGLVKPRE